MTGDATFNELAASSLVWLPAHGMGYYPVSAPDAEVYDDEYWKKYVGYAETPLGLALNRYRCTFTRTFVPQSSVVLDVGIGSGQFVSTLRGLGGWQVFGLDVNPRGIRWLQERGWELDPFEYSVDVATFWDTLEHIVNPSQLLSRVREMVLVSLPIFTGPDHVLRSKHFRPTEHRWYWTVDGLIAWMRLQSFRPVAHSTSETILGREDIHTFAFQRFVA